MANLFDRRTDIIYQGPEHGRFSVSRHNKKQILLPLIAHKVLVPYPKERQLNLFQETILKLFRSGAKSPSYIAERLLLHEELVLHIIRELKSKTLIDASCLVTPFGMKVLEDQADPFELRIGYVFYDLFLEDYWDVFLFNGQLTRVPSNSGELYRSYDMGGVAHHDWYKALVLSAGLEDAELKVPRTEDVLRVCIRHQSRMRRVRSREQTEVDTDQPRLPPNLEKVKYLGESIPLLAASYIFIPNDLGSTPYWQVCHPFGGGSSRKLRERLDLLKEEPRYAELKKEILHLTEEAYRVTESERSVRETDLEREAGAYLTGIFGEGIAKHAELHRQLVRLYGLSKPLSAMSVQMGRNYDTVQSKIRDYIDAVYQLMAEVLYTLKNPYMDYFRIEYLTQHPSRNGDILGEMARKTGFRDRQDGTVFPRMLSVKKGAVLHADGSKELKSLLAVNLLMANEVEEHPFAKLAGRVPQFIVFLDDLKQKRNSVSHSTEGSYLYDQVEIMFPRVMYLISILFDGLQFNYVRDNKDEITFSEGDLDIMVAEADKKLYLWSESAAENAVGLLLREYGRVRKATVDALFAMKLGKGNFYVSCSRVMEAVLDLWGRQVLDPMAAEQIKLDMKANLGYLADKLHPLGFRLEVSGLPESFTGVSPVKIKAFHNFERMELSPKLYAVLFSSVQSSIAFLEDAGKELPDLIEFVAELGVRRGHGNLPSGSAEEEEAVLQRLLETVKSLLSLFQRHQFQVN